MFSIKALIPILITIHLLFGGLVLILFKKEKSGRYWASGCLCLSLGLILVLLRGNFPDWLTYSVANLFTLFSWFLFFISIEILLGKKTKMLPLATIIVVCHGLIVESILHSALKPYLVIYLSTIWSIASLYFFFEILKSNRAFQNQYVAAMAYLFLGFSVVWGFHVALSLAYGLNLVMDEKFANWFTMLLNTMLAVMRQLDYFAIRFSLMSQEKLQIEKLLIERETLISNLLKANKTAATGALSASIAHELNQPLGASNINLFVLKRYLSKKVINDTELDEVIKQLEFDNQRATTIVKSLRSIFIEGSAKSETVRVGDLISKVLEVVKPELKEKHIQLKLRVEEDLFVKVSPSEIGQVLLNLLNNAIQALTNLESNGREILIEAMQKNSKILISVSDNGYGVSEERQGQLFELLTTTKQAGMGLGLWLCRHILTRYGGDIHYERSSLGGAKFVAQLPLATQG